MLTHFSLKNTSPSLVFIIQFSPGKLQSSLEDQKICVLSGSLSEISADIYYYYYYYYYYHYYYYLGFNIQFWGNFPGDNFPRWQLSLGAIVKGVFIWGAIRSNCPGGAIIRGEIFLGVIVLESVETHLLDFAYLLVRFCLFTHIRICFLIIEIFIKIL